MFLFCALGRSVLLLEARDRIGGRTYTVNKDGEFATNNKINIR